MNIVHIKVNVFIVERSLQIFYMMKIDIYINIFLLYMNKYKPILKKVNIWLQLNFHTAHQVLIWMYVHPATNYPYQGMGIQLVII